MFRCLLPLGQAWRRVWGSNGTTQRAQTHGGCTLCTAPAVMSPGWRRIWGTRVAPGLLCPSALAFMDGGIIGGKCSKITQKCVFFFCLPHSQSCCWEQSGSARPGGSKAFPHLFAFSFKQQLKSSNLPDYKFPNSPDPEHSFYSDAGSRVGEKVTTGSINIIWGDGAARGRGRRQSAH